jgi:Fur family transcriptional regulator, peroxide stress response regulator
MNKRYQNLINILTASGLRLTPQRMAICRILGEAPNHPTAQQIFEMLRPSHPSLSLATVYNTLEALINAGAVNALGAAGDDAVHYDIDTSPHINLACLNCHRVINFASEYIQELERDVQSRSGYHLLGSRVMYYGLCPDCQSKLNQSGK